MFTFTIPKDKKYKIKYNENYLTELKVETNGNLFT